MYVEEKGGGEKKESQAEEIMGLLEKKKRFPKIRREEGIDELWFAVLAQGVMNRQSQAGARRAGTAGVAMTQ